MLPLIHTVVLALHVLFAASWFGLGLALPSLARAAMARGYAEGGRVMASMNGSVVLFYVFALANWIIGRRLGFEAYDAWPYHAALTLGLVLVIIQFALILPGWRKLVNGTGTPDAEAGRRRIAMGVGLGHLVWIATFVLMYVGRGVIGG